MLQQVTDDVSTQGDIAAFEQAMARVAISADGTILRTNMLFLALFDYRAWDLAGRNRSIFLPSEADPKTEDAIRQVLEDGIELRGDIRAVRRDGAELIVEAFFHPVKDATGNVQEVVILMRDITEQARRLADEGGQIAAINTSQAVIHFALNGTVIDANQRFLQAMGYSLADIIGRHHSIFVDEEEAASAEYQNFWQALGEGRYNAGEFRRLGKGGRPVWLRATYSPVLDGDGQPFKVVKYATDVTAEKLNHADYEGQIAAIHKSQSVVTFDMDGTILDANDNFLQAVGYSMEEISGRHHRMFVDPSYAHGLEYEVFWSDLADGRHRSGEFRRIGKSGRDVWLQATYNPVFDQYGNPFKVVKYATVITREKLRQADHQGQIAAMHKSQSVISFALDGTIIDANDNFLTLTGYRLSEVRGQHHRMFVPAEERDSADYQEFWRRLGAGEHQSGEFKRICRNGAEVWLQASYNPIFDMNGRVFKIVKNAVDVTAEKLRQGDHEGQIAAISRSQCVVTFDMDGIVLDANDNFLDAMGYALDEIVGQHHSILVEPSFVESEQYRLFWKNLRDGTFLSSKFRRTGKDGREVWIQASYNPILDLNGKPFKIVKIAIDITADVALAADLSKARQEVLHDGLTGLPNRMGLADFMRKSLQAIDAKLSLLYLDLDHFKPINDTFGHHVGDHVLREIAARLKLTLEADQIVARVGGDEFVVAAPDLTREEAAALATRLISVVKDPIRHDSSSLTVGLSIGIAQAPHDARTEDELLRFADVALYRSKGGQKGTYSFFSDPDDQRKEEDRHLSHEMQFGIKANQFRLFFQPRFRADDGVLDAVETQVEWDHPERGNLTAEHFLPLAEVSGLIVPLGDWTLRTACNAALDWPLITVSVAVSPVQFMSGDLPRAVKLALRETGLPANRLEIRVDKSIGSFDIPNLRAELEALKKIGVRIVVAGQLVGEDATSGRESWPVDYVLIDDRTRASLERQKHESLKEIAKIEAALDVADGGHSSSDARKRLSLWLDRNAKLHAFLSTPPRSAEDVPALLPKKSA
ncbi:bifunctional diguanylate cyclase/phosphodiesterase [Neorhizobium sp. BT27B]|uniref:PAS domain S-box protein n=1 Tax=Neorhizobium sp. BT27B TaxID=3142625 RepID=UPI003D29E0B2